MEELIGEGEEEGDEAEVEKEEAEETDLMTRDGIPTRGCTHAPRCLGLAAVRCLGLAASCAWRSAVIASRVARRPLRRYPLEEELTDQPFGLYDLHIATTAPLWSLQRHMGFSSDEGTPSDEGTSSDEASTGLEEPVRVEVHAADSTHPASSSSESESSSGE